MGFTAGFACGAAATSAVWLLWRLLKGCGAEKPGGRQLRSRYAQNWAETRNFLCYDGTVMPVGKHKKEEGYGKNK